MCVIGSPSELEQNLKQSINPNPILPPFPSFLSTLFSSLIEVLLSIYAGRDLTFWGSNGKAGELRTEESEQEERVLPLFCKGVLNQTRRDLCSPAPLKLGDEEVSRLY